MLKLTHAEVMTSDIELSYPTRATAGRVVSGLLKAAVKAGRLKVERETGRVTGTTTWYVGNLDEFNLIRSQAIHGSKRD